jgi:MFS family permease
VAIGLFGATKNFFDAIYQYPGGWLADRVGRRQALQIFLGLASLGYLIYLVSPSWPFVFLGLALAMAWASMASPAVFAVIADALPKRRRAIGFTVQSLVKRVPMALAPVLGGLLLEAYGIINGIQIGLAVTIMMAAITALLLQRIDLPIPTPGSLTMRDVWKVFPPGLRRLLVADVMIRGAAGLVDVLIILYVTNILGVSVGKYGLLVAVQLMTSMMVYILAAKLADRFGQKPFVIGTFVCFALFPVAIVLSSGFISLVAAFVLGGLREIGEPARKAMIVDFAESSVRGRTVGLYYLIRSLSVTPAAALGGLLWTYTPSLPFIVAGIIGLFGTIAFAATVKEP